MSDTGLSVQEAIESIEREEASPEQVETQTAPEAEIEAGPSADTPEEAEEANPEGELTESDDTEEAEQAEPSAIEPPRFWDKEAKEAFLALPPNLQAIVVAKESERDKATSIALQKAAENGKNLSTEASKFAAVATKIDKALADADTIRTAKWGANPENIDWNAVEDQHGVDTARRLRNECEKDQRAFQQLQAAKAEADAERVQEFKRERDVALTTFVPELVDREKGAALQMKLVNYLAQEARVKPEILINSASAHELAIGLKAMKWDDAQSKAKAAAATPKPAPGPRMTVRPTASVAPGSQQSAKLRSLQSAFDRDPSIKNLVALETAQGK